MMKRFGSCCLALVMGCCAPLLVFTGAGSALYQSRKRIKLQKRTVPQFMCSIDADCPPGYECLNGRCVPAR